MNLPRPDSSGRVPTYIRARASGGMCGKTPRPAAREPRGAPLTSADTRNCRCQATEMCTRCRRQLRYELNSERVALWPEANCKIPIDVPSPRRLRVRRPRPLNPRPHVNGHAACGPSVGTTTRPAPGLSRASRGHGSRWWDMLARGWERGDSAACGAERGPRTLFVVRTSCDDDHG